MEIFFFIYLRPITKTSKVRGATSMYANVKPLALHLHLALDITLCV